MLHFNVNLNGHRMKRILIEELFVQTLTQPYAWKQDFI
jgi:hypothetical protein